MKTFIATVILSLFVITSADVYGDDDGEMTVPRHPKIVNMQQNSNFSYSIGDKLEDLECLIEGSPTPVVAWFKDGQRVLPNDLYEIEYDVKKGKSELEFKTKASQKIAGNYSCVAANFLGRATKNFFITVPLNNLVLLASKPPSIIIK